MMSKNFYIIHVPLTPLPVVHQNRLSDVASNNNLALVGRLHGIDNLIDRNPCQQGALSASSISTTVEAILAAVYQDGGLVAVRSVMRTLDLR